MTQNIALPGVGESNPTRLSASIRQLSERLGDYAPLESAVLTGDPQAPTPTVGDNSTSIATTAFVQTELADYATSVDLTDAIAQEVIDRDAAIAAAAYAPPSVATGTIQSNVSGSSATPSANPISAVLDNLLGTTRGNVAYRGASAWVALAPGTSGQYLKTNGSGADPAWAAVSQRVTSVSKPSDEGRSSSTTLTADGDLVLSVEANTSYAVEAMLFYTAAGGNIGGGITGPTGATGLFVDINAIGNTVASAQNINGTAARGVNTTVGTQAAGLKGILNVSSTAGSATLIWNRTTATGTTTLKAGSYLALTKIET